MISVTSELRPAEFPVFRHSEFRATGRARTVSMSARI